MLRKSILAALAQHHGWSRTPLADGGSDWVAVTPARTHRGVITQNGAVPANDREGCLLRIYDTQADSLPLVSFNCPTVREGFALFAWIAPQPPLS